MSEFKYACPVCGQHMKCDSSQSGMVSECPTCFQKIVVPQAPASKDPKFILTGSKYAEKKIPATLIKAVAAEAVASAPEKPFPMAVVIALAVLLTAAAAGLVFYGQIFKAKTPPPKVVEVVTNVTPEPAPAPAPIPEPAPVPKPKLVAPPANDTNWLMDLGAVKIANAPVAGRIHGQDFIIERANFLTNGVLFLRAGVNTPTELGMQINFSGIHAEGLVGKTINVDTSKEKAARVQLRWKDANGKLQSQFFNAGYALRLEFGGLIKNKLAGKIYLCTPDPEKSYLMGIFSADVSRPKVAPPAKK